MEDAPDWYGTHLDHLPFDWSLQEKLEIERWCEMILRNSAEEEMSPRQRLEATMAGDVRDRLLVEALYLNLYAVRTLDSAGISLGPADIYRNPKVLVRAHLATVAKYALDFPALYPISYGHEFWGGKSQMMAYGNPGMIGEHPIKCLEDLEGIEIPDPKKDGLYPAYLWVCREIKRIFVEYGLDKIVPLWVCIGVGPLGTAMQSMVGWGRFLRALCKDRELCLQSMNLATEWEIKFGQAVIDMGADCLMMCDYAGIMPIERNEWVVGCYTKIGKALGSQVPLWYGLTFDRAISWFPIMYEREAVGPGSFCGWFCTEMDYHKVIDFSHEHDLYCSCVPSDKVLLDGPISAIEEEIENRCEYGKRHSKFGIGIAAVDYLTPQEHFEAAVAAAKRHGRF